MHAVPMESMVADTAPAVMDKMKQSKMKETLGQTKCGCKLHLYHNEVPGSNLAKACAIVSRDLFLGVGP